MGTWEEWWQDLLWLENGFCRCFLRTCQYLLPVEYFPLQWLCLEFYHGNLTCQKSLIWHLSLFDLWFLVMLLPNTEGGDPKKSRKFTCRCDKKSEFFDKWLFCVFFFSGSVFNLKLPLCLGTLPPPHTTTVHKPFLHCLLQTTEAGEVFELPLSDPYWPGSHKLHSSDLQPG